MAKTDLALTALGWLLRALIIVLVVPEIQVNLFVPFIQAFLTEPSLDPWTTWLNAGRSADAFPYGFVMLMIHTPFVFVGQTFDVLVGGVLDNGRFAQIGFACSLLAFDAWLYRSLRTFMAHDITTQRRFGVVDHDDAQSMNVSRFLVIFYWLSPLILYVNYIHGQTDIIPTFFVMQSIILLERRRYGFSGLMLAIAMSAKLSVGLVVPFLMIYMYSHPAPLTDRVRWFGAFVGGILVVALSMVMIPGQLEIVVLNQALGDTLSFGVQFPNERTVLLFPLIYGGALAMIFFMAPLDRRSLYTLIALALMSVVAVSSANVGWYLWAFPLLLFVGIRSSTRLLAVLFAFWTIVVVADVTLRVCWWPAQYCAPEQRELVQAVLTTAITGLAFLIALRMIIRLVVDNPAYRMINRPVFVGVAGDSGAGKDTIVGALARLVGPHRSAVVLGDDYHLYARGARMWKALTHLNPRANDLHKLSSDLETLMRGKTILMHHYDHATGVFTRPRKIGPANLTLINGLHSLYQSSVAGLFDLKIFLKMDEELRRALKVARDVVNRSATVEHAMESIEARMTDAEKYVDPQQHVADLVCGLKRTDGSEVSAYRLVAESPDLNRDHRLCVEASVDHTVNLLPLVDALLAYTGTVAICSEPNPLDVSERQGIVVLSSDLSNEDVNLLAEKLLGFSLELLAGQAEFLEGHQGIMQLLALYVLEEKMTKGSQYGW